MFVFPYSVPFSISAPVLFIISASGGIIGSIFYMYVFNKLNKQLNFSKLFWYFNFKKKKNKGLKISKTKRWFIKIKNNYGVIGIAAITPCFLSIPIGCFLISKFFGNKKVNFVFLIISILFWALLMSILYENIIGLSKIL